MAYFGSEMHKCGYPGEQEKCPKYKAKCDIPGKVNLTCFWFRKDWLGRNGGSICTKALKKDEKGVYKE